jgi:hypothetical protein
MIFEPVPFTGRFSLSGMGIVFFLFHGLVGGNKKDTPSGPLFF